MERVPKYISVLARGRRKETGEGGSGEGRKERRREGRREGKREGREEGKKE
jgi:hypothetical protein